MSRRIFAAGSALVMAASLSVAGCSQNSQEERKPASEATSTAAEESESPTPSPTPSPTTESPTPSPTPTKEEYTPVDWFQAWAEPQGELVYSTDLNYEGEDVLHADFYARNVPLAEPLYTQEDQDAIDGGWRNANDVVPEVKAGDSIVVVEAVVTAKDDYLTRLAGWILLDDDEGTRDYGGPLNFGMSTEADWSGTLSTGDAIKIREGLSGELRPKLAEVLGQPTIIQEPVTHEFLEQHHEATDLAIEWPADTSVLVTSGVLPAGSFVAEHDNLIDFRLSINSSHSRLFRKSSFNEPDGQVQNYVLSREEHLGMEGGWDISLDLTEIME